MSTVQYEPISAGWGLNGVTYAELIAIPHTYYLGEISGFNAAENKARSLTHNSANQSQGLPYCQFYNIDDGKIWHITPVDVDDPAGSGPQWTTYMNEGITQSQVQTMIDNDLTGWQFNAQQLVQISKQSKASLQSALQDSDLVDVVFAGSATDDTLTATISMSQLFHDTYKTGAQIGEMITEAMSGDTLYTAGGTAEQIISDGEALPTTSGRYIFADARTVASQAFEDANGDLQTDATFVAGNIYEYDAGADLWKHSTDPVNGAFVIVGDSDDNGVVDDPDFYIYHSSTGTWQPSPVQFTTLEVSTLRTIIANHTEYVTQAQLDAAVLKLTPLELAYCPFGQYPVTADVVTRPIDMVIGDEFLGRFVAGSVGTNNWRLV